jgi:hypothetical protein
MRDAPHAPVSPLEQLFAGRMPDDKRGALHIHGWCVCLLPLAFSRPRSCGGSDLNLGIFAFHLFTSNAVRAIQPIRCWPDRRLRCDMR